MKYLKLIIILTLIVGFTGCGSVFNRYEEVAVDKLYLKKQCPTFEHSFEIPAKKFQSNDMDGYYVVMDIEALTYSLVSNTQAREIFNRHIADINKEVFIKDESASNSSKRVVKKIFVDQVCPEYHYTPEFVVRKLTKTFESTPNITYVVIPLDKMIFQMEKHKKTREYFNKEVKKLNLEFTN